MRPEDIADGWRLRLLTLGHLPTLAFHAACAHDLFSLLEPAPLTPAQLAARAGLNAEAVGLLLEALAALELVECRDGVYANLPVSSRFLVRGEPLCHLDIVAHSQLTGATLERAEKALREGHLGAPAIPPGHLDAMMAAMRVGALLTAERLVELVPAGENERLLDLGGGDGSYTRAYLSSRPDMTAVVVDLPPVAAAIEPLPRMEVRAGDMRSLELGGPYSLILLSNVLHYLEESDLEPLAARVAESLRPGGRVVVHDTLRGDDGRGPLYPALLALRFLTTAPGRGHTVGQVVEALRKAGLDKVTVTDLAPEPATLLVARTSQSG